MNIPTLCLQLEKAALWLVYEQYKYSTIDHFKCGDSSTVLTSTPQHLASLVDDVAPSIARFSSCLRARFACHLQGELILRCERGESLHISGHVHALDAFCVLARDDLDGVTRQDLRRELLLWFPEITENALPRHFREFWHDMLKQLSVYRSQMSTEELESFNKFHLHTTSEQVVSDLALPQKVFLSQGHTTILISFLDSMRTPNLPDDVLAFILDTLQLITRNLTVRFSSPRVQQLLVDLVREVTNTLLADLVHRTKIGSAEAPVLTELEGVGFDKPQVEIVPAIESPSPDPSVHHEQAYLTTGTVVVRIPRPHSVTDFRSIIPRIPRECNREYDSRTYSRPDRFVPREPRDLIVEMIQALFDILGTIAHPNCIEGAKQIVQAVIDDSVAPGPAREAAANAFRKVYPPTRTAAPLSLIN